MATTTPENWTVSKVVSGLDSRKDGKESVVVKIPDFQRGIVWSKKKQSHLIDSIRKGFPIGSLLMYKKGNSYQLIDGLQRSTSLKHYTKNPLQFVNDDYTDSLKQFSTFLKIANSLVNDFDSDSVMRSKLKATLSEMDFNDLDKREILDGITDSQEIANILWNEPRIKDSLKQLVDEIRSTLEINNYSIPVIVFEGNMEEIAEVFTRINSQGQKLSKLEVFAASWSHSTVDIDRNDAFVKEIIEHAEKRFQSLKDQDYRIEKRENQRNSKLSTFEYLFGVGKMLISKSELAISSNKELHEPETFAFQIATILSKSPISKMADLPNLLEQDPTPMFKAVSQCLLELEKNMKPIWDMTGNSKTKQKSSFHSENQIISILCDMVVTLYDSKYNKRDGYHQDLVQINKGIREHYLCDILTSAWKGSGDSTLYRRTWDNSTEITKSVNYYSNRKGVEGIKRAAEQWYSSQMEFKSKTRRIMNAQKLFCSYLYSKRVTVSTNSDQHSLLEYEHIIPVKRLTEAIGEGEGWPINNIANLMLLPKNLNGMKQQKTLKEFFRSNPNSRNYEKSENYLISEIDDIINIDGQTKNVFVEYCNYRWNIILDSLLMEAFGYTEDELKFSIADREIVTVNENDFQDEIDLAVREKYLTPQMIILEEKEILDFTIPLSKTLLGQDKNKSYCCTLPKPTYGAISNEFGMSPENLQESAKFVINGKFCPAQLRFINQNRSNVRSRRTDESPFRQVIQLEFKDIQARRTIDMLFSEQVNEIITNGSTTAYLDVSYVGNKTFTCKIKG